MKRVYILTRDGLMLRFYTTKKKALEDKREIERRLRDFGGIPWDRYRIRRVEAAP